MKFCKNGMDKRSDRDDTLPRRVSEIRFFCVVEECGEQILKGHCRNSDKSFICAVAGTSETGICGQMLRCSWSIGSSQAGLDQGLRVIFTKETLGIFQKKCSLGRKDLRRCKVHRTLAMLLPSDIRRKSDWEGRSFIEYYQGKDTCMQKIKEGIAEDGAEHRFWRSGSCWWCLSGWVRQRWSRYIWLSAPCFPEGYQGKKDLNYFIKGYHLLF